MANIGSRSTASGSGTSVASPAYDETTKTLSVAIASPWGIDAAGGYYNPDGAADGQAAVFTVASDGAFVLTKPRSV